MKRYLIFSGQIFSPGGGFEDYVDQAETIEECLIKIKETHPSFQEESEYDKNVTKIQIMCGPDSWAHIVDTETEKIVMRFYS